MKKCHKCSLWKNKIEFYCRKGVKDGCESICKFCKNNYVYGCALPPNLKKCSMCNVYKNVQDFKLNRARCKECRHNYEHLRWHTHKEVLRKRNRIYCRNRYKNDILFRMKENVRRVILFYLKKANGAKNKSKTWGSLTFNSQQLKEHLEKQFDEKMNWENYGSYWEIDHIYPQSRLLYDSLEHPNFLKCWDLDNLRPLEVKENFIKGNKLKFKMKEEGV